MAHDDYLQTCFKMIEMGSDVFVDGINSCWVNLPPLGIHDWPSWEINLYNSLQVFFKVDEAGEVPALDALSSKALSTNLLNPKVIAAGAHIMGASRFFRPLISGSFRKMAKGPKTLPVYPGQD